VSQFSDFAEEALATSIEVDGGEFSWNGRDIAGVISGQTITAAKSSFPAGYPPIGAAILVAGKKRQVKALANSMLELIPGGLRDKTPFVDDPSDPGLLIEFGSFAK
jgi:hypothetical protein